jgi:predicted Zn-dependent protease
MTVCTLGLSQAEAITLISEKQEIQIGRDIAKQVEKQYGLVKDDALQARVQKIGLDMAKVCERPKLPYSFKVLDSKEVNAFCLPGGFTYIFKGLVDQMPSDEELAGVIGHELGHVAKRHSIKQMEKGLGLTIASALFLGDKGGAMALVIKDMLMAGLSREDEREADHLGFVYISKAGYNPYSTLMSMKKLSEMDQPYDYGLFADHPESLQRVKAINSELTKNNIFPKVKELDNGNAQIIMVIGIYRCYMQSITVINRCIGRI